VHARPVHGPAQADDDVVLGHGVAVLVDLFLYWKTLCINTRNSSC
jgi:hypothetical protein